MRVLLEGGEGGPREFVARALASAGCAIAASDDAYDVRLTFGDVVPRRIVRGPLSIDVPSGQVRLDGRVVRLSRIEHALLVAIATAAAPLDRAALLRTIWGLTFDPGTNLVAVHVSRLRAKLGPGLIACGPRGYWFDCGRDALPVARLVGATGFEPATPRPPV